MRTRQTLIALTCSATLVGLSTLLLTACHSNSVRYSESRSWDAAPAEPPSPPVDRDGYRRDLRSGTLTAGHFDDAEDPNQFAEWAEEVGALGESMGFVEGFDQPAIQIVVVNEHGEPIHDAEVGVIDGYQRSSHVAATGRTGTDGRCVLLPGYDALGIGKLRLSIDAPGARRVIRTVDAIPGETIEIMINRAEASLPDELDLALIIDTTGSMADELEYLKVEFRAIVERIERRYPHVDQRWSLVVYRDQGDRYVVRDFDFTGSLRKMIDRLGEQSANGGGDYPEAVDQALQEANRLDWRASSAKVAFLIADAPPHKERVDQTMRAAQAMRHQGIGLYPVASSGVRAEAEYVFRSAALMTGGAYSFLTDDSGVGNAHAEPHDAPSYDVQRLDDLIVQLVESELSGESRATRRRNVIREVAGDEAQKNDRKISPQVRAWRERREVLVRMIAETDLSRETVSEIQREITQLDQRIAGASGQR